MWWKSILAALDYNTCMLVHTNFPCRISHVFETRFGTLHDYRPRQSVSFVPNRDPVNQHGAITQKARIFNDRFSAQNAFGAEIVPITDDDFVRHKRVRPKK